jgi:cytochrome c-type biogenesis protein CcmE
VLKRKRFFIGGLIVFLSVGYLGYTGFMNAATYYYTVGELLQQGNSIYGENVRVNGNVATGSLEQEAHILRFTILDAEGGASLPVVYQGVVPDTFKAGGDAIVEGYLNSDGIFQANMLMAKCPSRYEPRE